MAKTWLKRTFSQDELIKVTNEKRMLDEKLKRSDSNNRESAQLEIDNKRLTEKLAALRTEHESNQKWLKSQNDTLSRKQQVTKVSKSFFLLLDFRSR